LASGVAADNTVAESNKKIHLFIAIQLIRFASSPRLPPRLRVSAGEGALNLRCPTRYPVYMDVTGRRKSIAFFIALGVCLISVILVLYIGWILLNWRTGLL